MSKTSKHRRLRTCVPRPTEGGYYDQLTADILVLAKRAAGAIAVLTIVSVLQERELTLEYHASKCCRQHDPKRLLEMHCKVDIWTVC